MYESVTVGQFAGEAEHGLVGAGRLVRLALNIVNFMARILRLCVVGKPATTRGQGECPEQAV
jgi:hypothetical protein